MCRSTISQNAVIDVDFALAVQNPRDGTQTVPYKRYFCLLRKCSNIGLLQVFINLRFASSIRSSGRSRPSSTRNTRRCSMSLPL